MLSDSLERLLKDYKKPLEESNPPILAENKVFFYEFLVLGVKLNGVYLGLLFEHSTPLPPPFFQ